MMVFSENLKEGTISTIIRYHPFVCLLPAFCVDIDVRSMIYLLQARERKRGLKEKGECVAPRRLCDVCCLICWSFECCEERETKRENKREREDKERKMEVWYLCVFFLGLCCLSYSCARSKLNEIADSNTKKKKKEKNYEASFVCEVGLALALQHK